MTNSIEGAFPFKHGMQTWKTLDRCAPIFVEFFNRKKLELIVKNMNNPIVKSRILEFHTSKNADDDEKALKSQNTILKKYLKASLVHPTVSQWNAISVEYSQIPPQEKGGRYFARGSLSLANITRAVRHTIACDIYDDIDIKSAHPTFLRWWLKLNEKRIVEEEEKLLENEKKKKICSLNAKKVAAITTTDNLLLNDYVDNRDSTLQKIIDENPDFNKGQAKTILLKIMNGGCSEGDLSGYLLEYYKAMRHTIEIVNRYCDKRFHSRARVNKEGSTLNNVLCDIENRTLKIICDSLTEQGCHVDVLSFDGCFVRKDEVTEEMLRKAEKDVFDGMDGLKITLLIKKMDCGIDLTKLDAIDEKAQETSEEDLKRIFYEEYGKDSIYISPSRTIHKYNSEKKIWEQIERKNLVSVVSNVICDYASSLDDIAAKETLIKRMKKSSNSSPIATLFCDELKYVREEEFHKIADSNPYLLPFEDKVIDLRTGIVRPREKDDFITFFVNRKYKEKISSKTEKRIEGIIKPLFNYIDDEGKTVFDEETYKMFVKALAYSCTGLVCEKSFFICIGEKDTGKSLIASLFSHIFGVNFCTTISKKLIATKGFQSNIEDYYSQVVQGHRFGYCVELSKEDNLFADTLKKITGGDRFAYRPFGGTTIPNATTQIKIWLFTNEMPKYDTSDAALVERMKVFPFKNVFERNDELIDKFKEECSDDLFSWFIRHAVSYCTDGGKQQIISTPRMTNEKTIIQEDKHKLALFIEKCISFDSDAENLRIKDILQEYDLYIQKGGVGVPMTEVSFARLLFSHPRMKDVYNKNKSTHIVTYKVKIKKETPRTHFLDPPHPNSEEVVVDPVSMFSEE